MTRNYHRISKYVLIILSAITCKTAGDHHDEGIVGEEGARYVWSFGQWTGCSKECGQGIQMRRVSCMDRTTRKGVQHTFCDVHDQPTSRQRCSNGPCTGQHIDNVQWALGAWGSCSTSCDIGDQVQEVTCVAVVEDGRSRTVGDHLCVKAYGRKPQYIRSCNEEVTCPQWTSTDWTRCTADCGMGIQTRRVYCIQIKPSISTNYEFLTDTACSEDERPPSQQQCVDTSCQNQETRPDLNEDEKLSTCLNTLYSCCRDGKTAARGPNYLGCPTEEVVVEPDHPILIGGCGGTRHGCCEDGVTSALGENKYGCPETQTPRPLGGCGSTRYGCCEDGITSAHGENRYGCPENPIIVGGCGGTRYGCCEDGITSAGENRHRCPETRTREPVIIGGCRGTRYGCCDDGVTSAGENRHRCPETRTREPIIIGGCRSTRYGCCEDGVTAAGENRHRCPETRTREPIIVGGCGGTRYGCCEDGVTEAGENRHRCPETRTREPVIIGGCRGTRYGCCDDGVTSAGENRHRCPETRTREPIIVGGCGGTRYGCCEDGVTEAGENRHRCPETRTREPIIVGGCGGTRYGCCEDGVTEAGENRHRCPETRTREPVIIGGCRGTRYGCCDDGVTSAGENRHRCPETRTREPIIVGGCGGTQYGCCEDGVTSAHGENRLGCPEAQTAGPPLLGSGVRPSSDICRLASERGSCRDFTVRWYYDNANSRCDRFWYGGCDSNGNNFLDQDACKATCVNTPATPAPREEYKPGQCPPVARDRVGNCPNECSSDYDCLGAQKCCTSVSGCGRTCQFPHGRLEEFKPGSCPVVSLGRMGICVEACRNDYECQGAQKCCSNGCGHTCQDIQYERPEYKAGQCPALGRGEVGTCNSNCQTDYECDGTDKCCYNGCGYTCTDIYRTRVVLSAPSDLTVVADDSNAKLVTLNWQPPPESSGRVERYMLFYTTNAREDDDQWNQEAMSGDQLSFTINNLRPSTMYYFKTRASNREGSGIMSSIITYTTPAEKLVHSGLACERDPLRGSCSNYTVRWNYNTVSGGCKRFWYGGCDSNGNNFKTKDECLQTCSTPVKVTDVCVLPSVTGRCRAAHRRYFYNSAAGACEQFIYGGCNGNANRFTTRKECVARCGGRVEVEADRKLCADSTHGCCRDGVTSADGPDYYGCPDHCVRSEFGCCEDQATAATGPNEEGCDAVEGGSGDVDTDDDCRENVHGCCPDGTTPATGPNHQGCGIVITRPQPPSTRDCSLSNDRGPCSNYSVKWFYNSTNHRCERFWYGGCHGNGNRFENEADCSTSCVERSQEVNLPCNLPMVVGRCKARIPRYFFNQQTDRCEEFFYGGCDGNANNFQAIEQCRQTCEEIIVVDNLDTCQQPMEMGPCRASIPRYYYDSRTRECNRFTYGGCDGNDNNFAHQEDCVRRCKPNVVPLVTDAPVVVKEEKDVCRLPQETIVCLGPDPGWYYDFNDGFCKQLASGECGQNENNFDTKEECDRACSREHVCGSTDANPSAIQCNAYIRRYKYDRDSATCREFIYGGCGGNSNNFASQEACERKCITGGSVTRPMSQKEICALPKDGGPCFAYFQRYYYNSELGSCEQFIYGGCRGNENNFKSIETCQQKCAEDSTVDGSGEVEDSSEYCSLHMDTGPCRGSIPVWYYSHRDGQCKEFLYGGCAGNNNRFTSQEACEATCNRDSVCMLQPDKGNCVHSVQRYYYDVTQDGCVSLDYGGCGGNANNFETRASCVRKCGGSYVTPDPVRGDVCVLDNERGGCSNYTVKWYYSNDDDACKRFWFGGCDGNGNRFDTEAECSDRCGEGHVEVVTPRPRPTAAPVVTTPRPRPVNTPDPDTNVISEYDICDLESARGRCSNYTVKWHFNKDDQRCMRFWYGGCDGNANNFEDEDECNSICVDRRKPVTRAPVTPRPTRRYGDCYQSRFGCCPDGVMAAHDSYFSNCRDPSGDDSNDTDLLGGDASVIIEHPGQDVLLPCSGYKSGTNTGSIAWYRDAFLVSNNRRYVNYANGSLLIRSITSQDSGVYACRVTNGNVLPYIERYHLQVKVPIGIFPTPAKIVVKPGGNAFLHCQAYGSPRPTVAWTRGSVPVRSGGRFSVFNNGTLIITRVDSQDTGDYVCMASNQVSTPAQRIMMLSIRESLRVAIDDLHSKKPREGDRLYLTCRGYGYPAPGLTWKRLGNPLRSGDGVFVRQGDLRITNLTLDDTGLYTCTASNDEEKVEDSVSIQVLQKDATLPNCKDRAPLMKCRLIVTAMLCNYSIYSRQCCGSCERERSRLIG